MNDGVLTLTPMDKGTGITRKVTLPEGCSYELCFEISDFRPEIQLLVDYNGENIIQDILKEPGRICYQIEADGGKDLVIQILGYPEALIALSEISLTATCNADYLVADVLNSQDYYPGGSVLPGRSFNAGSYRYGFNGMEQDNEIKGNNNSLDFGERIYDPRIVRFLSVDPAFKNFPFMSPYIFAGGDPIRFKDVYGMGPGDRVKKAESFEKTPYVQELTVALRTGTDAAGLANMDCSELVCRVLAADGITSKIKSMNTSALKSFLNNPKKFHKSNKPQVGDVFLWRIEGKNGHGHTGIVSRVNDDGTITITHAKGKAYGTVIEDINISSLTNHKGWEGFYRPVNENYGNMNGLYAELDDLEFMKSTIQKDLKKGNYGEWGTDKQGLEDLYKTYDKKTYDQWEKIGQEFEKSQDDQDFTPADIELKQT